MNLKSLALTLALAGLASSAQAGWNVYLVRDGFGPKIETTSTATVKESLSEATDEVAPDLESAGWAVLAGMPESFRHGGLRYHYCKVMLLPDGDGGRVRVYLYRQLHRYSSVRDLHRDDTGIDAIAIDGEDLEWMFDAFFRPDEVDAGPRTPTFPELPAEATVEADAPSPGVLGF